MDTQITRKWYQEPLMWLVLGLPALVVVAGVATMMIAASHPESLVSEPHSKIGFTVKTVESSSVAR